MAVASEEARERKRERDRIRIREKRAVARAAGAAEAPAPVAADERPAGGASGGVLGVYALGVPGDPLRFDVLYQRGEREHSPNYAAWLSIPYGRAPEPAVLVTPLGRYSFDPEDVLDIARCAALAIGDLPDANENALRSALSKVERGRVFTVEAENYASASVRA